MTARGSLFDWPGLSPLAGKELETLAYERGVWGKAHGVATDYRWLARSEGFSGHDQGLVRELVLGPEDAPRNSTYWRALPYGHFAVGLYASRARDAANRGEFSEKQILALAPGVPPALGALLLLPFAAHLDDEVWWSRRRDQPWQDRDFFLRLPEEDHRPLEIHRQHLEETVEAGCRGLERWGEATLTELYSRLLARKAAWLLESPSPLAPESLAVLLLPLPAELAAEVSLASWIPSSRADLGKLRQLWSVGVRPDSLSFSETLTVEPSPSEEARRMARALLDGNPESLVKDARAAAAPTSAERSAEGPVFISAGPASKPRPAEEELDDTDIFEPHPPLPDVKLPAATRPRPSKTELLKPRHEAPATLNKLYDFARNAEHRWLEPKELPRLDSPVNDGDAEVLKSWVHDLVDQMPQYEMSTPGPLKSVDYEQWEVKIDLLRAAALVCHPRSSTFDEIGEFKTERIPPLFFLGLLEERTWQRLRGLGDDNLRKLVKKSRECKSPTLRRRIVPLLHHLEDRISSRKPSWL